METAAASLRGCQTATRFRAGDSCQCATTRLRPLFFAWYRAWSAPATRSSGPARPGS
jgi:hypothetical protein